MNIRDESPHPSGIATAFGCLVNIAAGIFIGYLIVTAFSDHARIDQLETTTRLITQKLNRLSAKIETSPARKHGGED